MCGGIIRRVSAYNFEGSAKNVRLLGQARWVTKTIAGLQLGILRFVSDYYHQSDSYSDLSAEVEVTMDLSNRPCLTHNLSLSSNKNGEEYAGDLSIEMLDHVLESLVMNSRSTVHIVERKAGKNVFESAMATAKAYGKALRLCSSVDPRRAGKTASSKGTLSV